MTLPLDALSRHASLRPQDLAFSDDTGTVSFAQLLGRVGALAGSLSKGQRIGIFGPACIEWVIADLAVAAAGATAIPLPSFFSPEQINHILADAAVELILAGPESLSAAARLGLPVQVVGTAMAPLDRSAGGTKIIYTSGSTGRPKGVMLGAEQIDSTCRGLVWASHAETTDRHLSVLPFSLLLENITGIYLPLIVGGTCHMTAAVATADSPMAVVAALMQAVETVKPTTLVLVPELLRGWVAGLELGFGHKPTGLRFVAVGGAPVAAALADRAWAHGIPVHEGYGLSECCSVVAVNRPGRRKAGTVGEPLFETELVIDQGEIVVRSPSVMQGYLNQPPIAGIWRTGDLGSIDADGYVQVLGRKDSLLVLSSGRNVNPEWVEAVLLADVRIGRCIILGHGRPYPVALIVPSVIGEDWLKKLDQAAQAAFLEAACAGLPGYARPRRMLLAGEEALRANQLVTPNNRPRRREIATYFAAAIDDLYAHPAIVELAHGIL